MGNYTELKVCQISVELAVDIYKNVKSNHEFREDYRLKNQLCAAAVSIASNIAVGDSMNTDKHSIRYFYIAKGSVAELKTRLIISNRIGYLGKDEFLRLVSNCDIIAKMLSSLINSRKTIKTQYPT